jgi:hypothetical protein
MQQSIQDQILHPACLGECFWIDLEEMPNSPSFTPIIGIRKIRNTSSSSVMYLERPSRKLDNRREEY